MSLIKVISDFFAKFKARNVDCNAFLNRINVALKEVDTTLRNEKSFVDPCWGHEWFVRYSDLLADDFKIKFGYLRLALKYKKLLLNRHKLIQVHQSLKQQISAHNSKVASLKVNCCYELIGDVEGRKLDRQQTSCVVKDVHNHLVVAGAGTGKTTTVVGKVKYLLATKKYLPQEILVLSFTNASASEMCERIKKETDCNIEACTFHKLGLSIISTANRLVPRITKLDLKKFIKEQLQYRMNSSRYFQLLCSFLFYGQVLSKSEFDFTTQEEYDEFLRLNPPFTVQKEQVKSYGEMDIANFLTQNGIQYIYEAPYQIDTRSERYGQYYPDFYLPDYNIYIEYFGINKAGNVPSYFTSSDGLSASETYRASMEWKRSIHKENGTTLVECFAYENFDGTLLDNLKTQLEANSVEFNPMSSEELWDLVADDETAVLDGIIDLFETIINLIKCNNYTFDDVKKLNVNNSNVLRNKLILKLLEPIFDAYSNYLIEHNEIDFNDMINLATQIVQEKKYVNPYRFVIVDEYQDISKSRFALLEALRKSTNYDVFCVGDDWQSIYRFAGSDIGYILDFERFWGPTELSKIETTYRFPQRLIDISGSFIMQNPQQLRKSIRGNSSQNRYSLGQVTGYQDEFTVSFMLEKLDDLPKGSTVFFIGRYSFDSQLLDDNPSLECKYNNTTGFIDVKYSHRPDLQMSFLTAHRSKGLQADFVFIINNKDAKMGFPSKIHNAPILELLLDTVDAYPYAEERRLFYVALTRAKQKVFLLVNEGKESSFVLELKERHFEELRKEKYECPWCGGQVRKINGKYGGFFGCSNYFSTGCRYTRTIGHK